MEGTGLGKRIARKLWSLLGVTACFGMTATSPALAQTAAQPPLTVHVDPQTGRILSAPAPGTQPLELSPEIRNSMSTSHQGLTEVPGSQPGGGMKVDLQGRFQSPLLATTDEQGRTKMQHLPTPTAPGSKQ